MTDKERDEKYQRDLLRALEQDREKLRQLQELPEDYLDPPAFLDRRKPKAS